MTQLEARIADLQGKLADAEARLKEATEFGRYIHPIDFVDVKMLFSRYPQEARVLERILNLRERGAKWRLGGQSPTEGFDSPSFAAFILRELNLPGGDVRPGVNLEATSRRLWERLPSAPQPRVGDLVFYPAGYALFYFVDQKQRPFVIGMTPFGIAALEPNFAKVVGYRRVGR
ncbi:MAG: C40 family peptidase [Deltaproteobacteria bacterium]|nr:C40 family peptidase [Deltaproteobacteria bacterium]